MMTEIKVTQYTRFPGPRYKKLGKGSGEEFRDGYLWPTLQKDKKLAVDLDGTAGYGSSFLEEAFGGLVRKYDLSDHDIEYIMNHLKSKNNPTLIAEIKEYMQDALNARKSKR